jgi:DNA-binding transcriptional ArsR family regulator
MARAQEAVEQVVGSQVNAEGLLDDAGNAVMLPVQEWEIARLLAKLSELRAEHQEVVSEGVTPEVAAVAEALGEALDSSQRAVLARVEALERYAGHVADAERAYRARRQIERFSARLPRYEELLAESGAGGSAVPELGRLSDDADRLEQALRNSVSSAHEAFRHLRG